MKTKSFFLINLVLIAAFFMNACKMTVPSAPASTGTIPVNVVGWNLDNQAEGVVNTLFGNNESAEWRRGMQEYLMAGNKVDVFIDCDDGRVSASSQFYARIVTDGGQTPYHFAIGSLAGEITPEMIQMVNIWISKGWIRSINVSSHTCEGGTCGAQGVKKELDAGKTIAEFESHGVGDAATWIQNNLDSPDPDLQVRAQVEKIWQGTNGQVPVIGWKADHATQIRQLMDVRYTGRAGEDQIVQELVRDNADSASIMAEQAKAQGLDMAQSFSKILVTDWPGPAEKLLNLPGNELDQVFNISFVVPEFATPEQVESAFGPVRAALQYALAHANEGTEVIFMFQQQALLDKTLAAAGEMKVYQDFLANSSFKSVQVFTLYDHGRIASLLLVKPQNVAVSMEMTIGPYFRGKMIHGKYVLNGQTYALIHGGNPETDGATMVTLESPGVYKFARTFTKFAHAKFFMEGNLAGDPELNGQVTLAKFGSGGGVVYTPDYGEEVFAYLARTGRWDLVPEFATKIEQMLLSKCNANFCSVDIHHGDQFMFDEVTGKIRMADWTPGYTLSGAELMNRFASPAAYQLYVQRELTGMINRECFAMELLSETSFRQYLPIQWPTLTTSSFTFAGSTLTMAGEQVIAFERAVVDLGSTSPEVVMAARNTLAGMGAKFVDGQWVIFGTNSVLASGPIRFSQLTTLYPDGAKAFVGYQTRQWGAIGFERAENVSGGMFGWRMYAPRLFNTLEGRTIAGIPASKVVSEVLSKGLVLIWVGFVADDIHDYATQTDHMAVGPNTYQVFDPPQNASSQVWFRPEKWGYPSTTFSISLENLQSGCNGTGLSSPCGAYLESGIEKPLLLYGALAGNTIPQMSWPSFGIEGNSILATWSYMRSDDGTFTVWHNDQVVQPGSAIDYYELKMNEFGMWLIPYHAELQTATCAGLCIQQSHGGEELLFEEGAQPVQLDLCPQGNGVEDPCVWRP